MQYHLAEIFRNPVKNQNLAYFTAIRKIRPLLGGCTSSTVSGKNVTLNQFNSMQRLREQLELTDMSKDEVCSVFARYVTETATTPKDQKEKLLMRDTCTQYVSGVKNLAFARFPKNEIWWWEVNWVSEVAHQRKRLRTAWLVPALRTLPLCDTFLNDGADIPTPPYFNRIRHTVPTQNLLISGHRPEPYFREIIRIL